MSEMNVSLCLRGSFIYITGNSHYVAMPRSVLSLQSAQFYLFVFQAAAEVKNDYLEEDKCDRMGPSSLFPSPLPICRLYCVYIIDTPLTFHPGPLR